MDRAGYAFQSYNSSIKTVKQWNNADDEVKFQSYNSSIKTDSKKYRIYTKFSFQSYNSSIKTTFVFFIA